MAEPLVAVVTGSNSGIGRSAAVDLAAKGWTVYGTMRSLDKGAKLTAMAEAAGVTVRPVICDVTDTDSVNAAMAHILRDAGRIDVLVNNAGVGGNATVEECSIDRFAEVMDVNLHGLVRCIQAVLPHMRERGSGTIVNVTSVIGRFAAAAQAPYVASKWAAEGMSQELAQEVAPFGIRVVIVEPGVIKTAIMAKNLDAPNASGAYDKHYERLLDFYAAGLADPGHPSVVAETIYESVTTDEPKLRWTCGWCAHELTSALGSVADEDWIALGTIDDNAEYRNRFSELYGLDIRLPSDEMA
jgi:NAD(P)-dependent dehydrogenase (short-subunit alcohol dehydrogenase family)